MSKAQGKFDFSVHHPFKNCASQLDSESALKFEDKTVVCKFNIFRTGLWKN